MAVEALETRRLMATVSGTAYWDVANNNAFDAGDNPVAGVTVYVDVNNDGSFTGGEPTAVSNGSGAYSISGVPIGSYNVRQNPPANFFATNAPFVAFASTGAVVSGINLFDVLKVYQGNGSGNGFTLRQNAAHTKYEMILDGPTTYTLPLNIPSVSVVANDGDDVFTVDYVNGSPIPTGGVSYDGGNHTNGDALVISGSAAADTFVLNSGEVGNGGTITYSNTESVTVNTLGGADTVYADFTGITTTINGGSETDLVTVGVGNLDSFGPLTINGDGGTDIVDIDDSLASFDDTYTITDSTVGRDFWNGLTYHAIENLTLHGETGNNTYNINSAGDALSLAISDTGGGNDTFNVGAGNLDYLGSVLIDAGSGGSDQIFVKDDAETYSDTYTITSTTLARNFFAGLTYANAESIQLNAEHGANTIDINSTSCVLHLYANGGSDTINVNETSAAGCILYPSTGDDALNVNTDNTGFAWAIAGYNQRIGALTVGSGGLCTLYPALGEVVTATSVSISTGGAINVNDGALIVDYTGGSPMFALKTWLTNGYAGGAWNGASGIHSGTANVTPGTAVGIAEATDIGSPATFAGQNIDNTCVLLRYTLNGDANLDKTVDTVDFSILAANFSASGMRWSKGDFDFNSSVNSVDFNLLVSKFSQSLAAPSADASLAVLPALSAPPNIFGSTTRIGDVDAALPTDELR